MRFITGVALSLFLSGCSGCNKGQIARPVNSRNGRISGIRPPVGPSGIRSRVSVPASIVPPIPAVGEEDAAREVLAWQRAAREGPAGDLAVMLLQTDDADVGAVCGRMVPGVSVALRDLPANVPAPVAWHRMAGDRLLTLAEVPRADCADERLKAALMLSTLLPGASRRAGSFAHHSGFAEFCDRKADAIRALLQQEQPWAQRINAGDISGTFAMNLPSFCPQIFSSSALSEVAVQQFVRSVKLATQAQYTELNGLHRNRIFSDSIPFLHRAPGFLIHDLPRVGFVGEVGVDAGGPRRDWFDAIAKAIFVVPTTDPAGGLFVTRPGTVYLELDLSRPFNQDHYVAVGEYIGFALALRLPLGVPLSGMFFAKLLFDTVRLEDLAFHEPQIKRGLDPIASGAMDLADLGIFDTGAVPTAAEYIRDELDKYAPTAANNRFAAIRRGLNRILSVEQLRISAYPIHLAAILFGSPTIDLDDMRAHTNVGAGIEQQVAWFWAWMGRQNNATRRKFIHFVTGFSQLPINGFAGLPQRISIRHTWGALESHTCFFALDMPRFDTAADLDAALDVAMVAYTGFDMG